LSNSVINIGASTFSNSSLLEISFPIALYPEKWTFSLNQSQFNNLNWENRISVINSVSSIYNASTDSKLFIAKLINQALSTSTTIFENNLKSYTFIAANAFENNVLK